MKYNWLTDKDEAFLAVAVINSNDVSDKEVLVTNGTKEFKVLKSNILKEIHNDLHLVNVDDMLNLLDIDKPVVLTNLRNRFMLDKIYTEIGDILITINPYKHIPHLYSNETLKFYLDAVENVGGKFQTPPHVYNISLSAYQKLEKEFTNQSIIISGESGSGKTEVTKICLNFFSNRSAYKHPPSVIVKGIKNEIKEEEEEQSLERKLLSANPVLEAFGNSKTTRNDNSSRFGKYMEVFFAQDGLIRGCKTSTYLLEKARVIKPSMNERNFHIFYQIVTGANDELRNKINLLSNSPSDYLLLSQSGSWLRDGLSDQDEFRSLLHAMNEINFTSTEQDNIFKIVSSILHLGNVSIVAKGDETSIVLENKAALEIAASLLGISFRDLDFNITHKILIVNKEKTIVTHSVESAYTARDSLIKQCYDNLFKWIVEKVNSSLSLEKDLNVKSIGILDIFGFEILLTNSFEQLCINFCNEVLQQQFVTVTFKNEKALFEREGIDSSLIPKFIDNILIINFIAEPQKSLLALLDEELKVPKYSDGRFLQKFSNKYTGSKIFRTRGPGAMTLKDDEFTIQHYAGKVTYSSTGFLLKNRDQFFDNLAELIQTSTNDFVKRIFPKVQLKNSTLGFDFRNQLEALISKLNSTTPHYVRCIKPNGSKKALEFSGSLCLEQLNYSGVFEAIDIFQRGFPFKMSHNDFIEAFWMLDPKLDARAHKSSLGCEMLCKNLSKISPILKDIKIGKTITLFKSKQQEELVKLKNLIQMKCAIQIQAWMRGHFATKRVVKIYNANERLNIAVKKRTSIALQDALLEAKATGLDNYNLRRSLVLHDHICAEDKVKQSIEKLLVSTEKLISQGVELEMDEDNSREVHDALQIINLIDVKHALQEEFKKDFSVMDDEELRAIIQHTELVQEFFPEFGASEHGEILNHQEVRKKEKDTLSELLSLLEIDEEEILTEGKDEYNLQCKELEEWLIDNSDMLTLLIESDELTSEGMKILKGSSIVLSLRKAFQNKDLVQLSNILNENENVPLTKFIETEIHAYKQLLLNEEVFLAVSSYLESNQIKGEVGYLSYENVDVNMFDSIQGHFENQITTLLESTSLILDISNILSHLRISLKEKKTALAFKLLKEHKDELIANIKSSPSSFHYLLHEIALIQNEVNYQILVSSIMDGFKSGQITKSKEGYVDITKISTSSIDVVFKLTKINPQLCSNQITQLINLISYVKQLRILILSNEWMSAIKVIDNINNHYTKVPSYVNDEILIAKEFLYIQIAIDKIKKLMETSNRYLSSSFSCNSNDSGSNRLEKISLRYIYTFKSLKHIEMPILKELEKWVNQLEDFKVSLNSIDLSLLILSKKILSLRQAMSVSNYYLADTLLKDIIFQSNNENSEKNLNKNHLLHLEVKSDDNTNNNTQNNNETSLVSFDLEIEVVSLILKNRKEMFVILNRIDESISNSQIFKLESSLNAAFDMKLQLVEDLSILNKIIRGQNTLKSFQSLDEMIKNVTKSEDFVSYFELLQQANSLNFSSYEVEIMKTSLSEISALILEANDAVDNIHVPKMRSVFTKISKFKNNLLEQYPIFGEIKLLLSKPDEYLISLRLQKVSSEQEKTTHLAALQDYNEKINEHFGNFKYPE